jgi:iron complex outermembrane receptor protein
LDIDDLIRVRVTSVARKEQTLTDVPAAVYVIRQEDLKRSGATSIPEALRAVPGFHVARNRSSVWAVSPRGFSDELSNKLLVLIDGRSVYSPLHSGVYWDVQDVLLEDVDRIEAVRGPGGTLWGANAINGVVNIITKPAEDTQGGLVTIGGGTEERVFSSARYGFKASDEVSVRVYR